MPNRNLRNLIVSEARSWIDTRFHHQGRLKKSDSDNGGVDCIGLVLGVFDTLGVNFGGVSIRNFDKKDYAKIPDGKMLKEEFCKYLKEINPIEVESGDILMFKFDKEPQHVGIVVKEAVNLNIIHCYMKAKQVVEHRLDECWKNRIVAAFSLFS